MRNFRWIVPLIMIGLCLGGCQSSHKPREEAVKRWNDARASVLQGLAENQYKSGEFDQARKTLDQALVLVPDSAKLRILSARIALEQGRLELAGSELEQARKLDPKNADADYFTGIVYQRWQKPDIALKFYADASQKAPTEPAYLLAQSEMLVALNHPDQALALLQSKLAYFEHSAAICDAIGSIYMNQGSYAQAADYFRQASVFADDDQGIREHLAMSLYMAREYARAVPVFERLMTDPARAKRPDLQQAIGDCLMNTHRAGEALGYLQSAAQARGDDPTIWVSLGRCELELSDPEQARAALSRALSLRPASYEANLLMGYVQLRRMDPAAALRSFQAASRADATDSTSLCMAGLALQKLGRLAEAKKQYDAALKLSPKDELASRLLAGVD